MDNFVKSIYVDEIEGQCEYAALAVQHLNNAKQQLNTGDAARQKFFYDEVFRNIHSFLTHASNVSRMFWPSYPRREKSESDERYEIRRSITDTRAKALRKEYSLKENNVLKNTSLRNHLEHYDERLDHWSQNSKGRNIATTNIGPLGSISPSSDPLDNMRQFDSGKNIYRFRGEDYDLQEIATAIDEIILLSQNLKEKLQERRSQST